MQYEDLIIIIPARKASKRLPDKCMMDIGGKPMIQRVIENALNAEVGPVAVATDDAKVYSYVNKNYHNDVTPIMAEGDINSGSDRCAAALVKLELDKLRYAYVINLQCDSPFIPPELIKAVAETRVYKSTAEVVTAYCKRSSVEILEFDHFDTRYTTFDRVDICEHIGIYAFVRTALIRFNRLKQSKLELKYNLELLRDRFQIDFVLWPYMPLEINTEADIQHVRELFK